MPLTEKQRRHLRGLGHALKPIVFVGQAGITAAVIAEAAHALDDHELVKVRISGMERDARDAALEVLAQGTKSELVGRIGHTALLYRPNPQRRHIYPG